MPNYKDIVCPRSIAKESQLQAKKKNIFDAAGKIGKLEFLNDFGGGSATTRKALEQVAVLSNSIRVGDTTTDTSATGGLLDESGGGLMEAMELGGGVQAAVAAFDPGAVNGAVGASKSIVARAKQGNFRMEDIATAGAEFKNIAQIAKGIFKKPLSGDPSADYQKFKCRPSPYAADLVHRAPKQNFQFVVEIVLSAPYREQFLLAQSTISDKFGDPRGSDLDVFKANNLSETNDQLSTQLAFLVKNSGRPSISYEYEDLNYYNYRTKGIRKATYNPVTMTFIDDQLNSAAAFYAFYMSAMSPIANTPHDRGHSSEVRKNYEQTGMDFSDYKEKQLTSGRPNTYPAYSASVGALRPLSIGDSNTTTTVMDRISIYQYGKNGNTFTAFNMFKPKIMTFNPSDVDHADSGNGQELSMDIDYDYFTIQPDLKIGTDISADDAARLSGEDAGALFPNRYFGPNDVPSGGNDASPGGLLSKVGGFFGL